MVERLMAGCSPHHDTWGHELRTQRIPDPPLAALRAVRTGLLVPAALASTTGLRGLLQRPARPFGTSLLAAAPATAGRM